MLFLFALSAALMRCFACPLRAVYSGAGRNPVWPSLPPAHVVTDPGLKQGLSLSRATAAGRQSKGRGNAGSYVSVPAVSYAVSVVLKFIKLRPNRKSRGVVILNFSKLHPYSCESRNPERQNATVSPSRPGLLLSQEHAVETSRSVSGAGVLRSIPKVLSFTKLRMYPGAGRNAARPSLPSAHAALDPGLHRGTARSYVSVSVVSYAATWIVLKPVLSLPKGLLNFSRNM